MDARLHHTLIAISPLGGLSAILQHNSHETLLRSTQTPFQPIASVAQMKQNPESDLPENPKSGSLLWLLAIKYRKPSATPNLNSIAWDHRVRQQRWLACLNHYIIPLI